MLHSLSPRCLILLILLLGSWCSLASCDDDDGEEEAAPEPDAEPEPDSVEEEATEPPHTSGDDGCMVPAHDTKEMCCKMNLDIDDATIKCFMLHQKKMPKKSEMESNPASVIKFFSCLVECVYKSKKYIGKGDSLNMKTVKADAEKKYKGLPDRKQHHIEMYEHCQRQGKLDYGKIKSNPAAKVLFTGSCKPYFVFVFICIMEYGKISCPYYTWTNHKEFKEKCQELRTKCEDTHG